MKHIGGGLVPAVLGLIGLLCAVVPGITAPPAPLDRQVSQLDQARQQCIAAAAAVQQRERTIGALDLAINAMQNGVDTKNRELAASRQHQEVLLGALEHLARAPPEALAFAPEGPADRLRSTILIAAAVPALSAEAHTLATQLVALSNVQSQIAARRKEIDDAHTALAKGREALAHLAAHRAALIGEMLHDDGKHAMPAQLGDPAGDIFDLIRRADAEADRHDKERLAQLHAIRAKGSPPVADPTKPTDVRALDAPHAEMVWPVSGELIRRFGEADHTGRPSQGLAFAAVPVGVVVSPFDGRIDYAGPFRGYGLILIIRHAGGYHSTLAGMGRVDVTTGQWVLAGEPVGSLPGADDKGASATVYLELRRDGRPVDPQSRMGSRDQKTEDVRVRE